MHCRVTLSTSTCAGLSLEWAPTRTMHFPIFLPFFLVGTLMPVNAPLHDESVGDIFRWPGLQWPVACSFFLSAPTAQPDTLWQSARLKVQDFVEPATEHSVLPSGTLPLWSWISIRHSGACCAPRTSGARASSALAPASTATRPSRGRFTVRLDIEFPPSGSQLSRSFRLAVELAPGQYCLGRTQRAPLYRDLRPASEDRAGGQRGGTVVSPVVSGNTSTQTCRRLPRPMPRVCVLGAASGWPFTSRKRRVRRPGPS